MVANTANTLTYQLTNNAHHMMAKNYISAVNRMDPPHYFFFGRSLAWPDELCPPNTSDYFADEVDIRNNIVYIDRITGGEVSHVIKRFDWTAGQVFDRWDPRISDVYPAYSGATEIFNSKMFCFTPEYHIYKCIDNNNNEPCYDQPTGTSIDYINTTDGYVWKYMMTVSEYSRLAFLNESWVPVNNVIHAESLASTVTVTVDAVGSGYDPRNTIIVINGDGIGAQARPIIMSGQITGVEMEALGSGYSYATAIVSTPDLTLPRGTGAQLSIDFPIIDLGQSQANVQLTAVSGDISSITVTSGGSNYTTASVLIEGDGSGASAEAVVVDGSISKINILTRGSGYTYATVTIVGSGFNAGAYAIVSPAGGHGHDIVEETRSRVVATKKTVFDVNLKGVTDWPDFRQCGIWTHPDKTPIGAEFRTLFKDFSGTTCWGINSSQIFKDDYVLDQKLVRQTDQTEWYVVAREDQKLVLMSLTNDVPVQSDVFYDELGAYKFGVDLVEPPDVVRHSGLIMFYDNDSVYHAVEDSSVQATIYIEF